MYLKHVQYTCTYYFNYPTCLYLNLNGFLGKAINSKQTSCSFYNKHITSKINPSSED